MSSVKLTSNKIIGLLYGAVVILFSLLEPWGNIDTRDFSYMGLQKFWEYNFFIFFILIGMVVLGIMLWKNKLNLKTEAKVKITPLGNETPTGIGFVSE